MKALIVVVAVLATTGEKTCAVKEVLPDGTTTYVTTQEVNGKFRQGKPAQMDCTVAYAIAANM